MAEKEAGDVNVFIQQYGAVADRIGKELDVDPKILLAQFGIETGYGKSIVPGTFNLGNIKSANKGVKAKDNATGSVDPYLKFEDADTFADYYVDYMKRRFPSVVGTGSDVTAFTAALRPGEQGGYAEDKNYGSKLSNGFSLINARMESAGAAPVNPNDAIFGVGKPTVADEMRQSGFGEQQTPNVSMIGNKEDAALVGAGAGLLAGRVAQKSDIPNSAKYNTNVERLRDAQTNLATQLNQEQRTGGGRSAASLERELEARRADAFRAADEMQAAKSGLRAPPDTTLPSLTSADDAPGRASGPKVAGGSASSNYAKAMAGERHQLPNQLLAQVEDYTGSNPKGAHSIIQQDLAALERIKQLGGGDFALTGTGAGQIMVPPDVAASRAAAMDAELSQRQAAEAAEQSRLAQAEQARVQAAQARLDAAAQGRRTTGAAVGQASQAVKDARRSEAAVNKASGAVDEAQARVDRTPSGPQGVLQKTGKFTAKVAPKTLGVLSGAGTGMAAMEAIDRFKKGDYSGAVLPTIEATLGVMSMLPPTHPVLLALRGIGTIGGAALGAYEIGKAGKEVYDARQ